MTPEMVQAYGVICQNSGQYYVQCGLRVEMTMTHKHVVLDYGNDHVVTLVRGRGEVDDFFKKVLGRGQYTLAIKDMIKAWLSVEWGNTQIVWGKDNTVPKVLVLQEA